MSSRNTVYQALDNHLRGDVEKYFHHLTTMMPEENSGVHDFTITSSDCYNNNAPFKENQFTRFNLTNNMDIIDISKGFITMRVNVDVQFVYDNLQSTASTTGLDSTIFWVGFKNALNLISVYQVHHNNMLTSIKNTKAHQTLGIAYMCKAKEETVGRPYMYSPHHKILDMDTTVCGTYIKLPPFNDRNAKQVITLEMCFQVDDIPEFSGFSLYPQFLCKNLELEISTNLQQCMCWCQIPVSKAIENIGSDLVPTVNEGLIDTTIYACGDFNDNCYIGYNATTNNKTHNKQRMTIQVSNLTVESARSFIYGFNVSDKCKQAIVKEFNDNGFVVPCTNVEHYTFSQLPTTHDIKTNIQLSLWNASQIILTFPNSANTGGNISYNPHLLNAQLSIGTKIIPDKMMNTVNDPSQTELVLSGLGLDSLFSASEELLESLSRNRGKVGSWTPHKKDAGSYIMLFDLERASGYATDGISGSSVPLNFQATYMYGEENPHYYEIVNGQKQLRRQNVDIYIISDSFFVFSPNGGQYIKDSNIRYA